MSQQTTMAIAAGGVSALLFFGLFAGFAACLAAFSSAARSRAAFSRRLRSASSIRCASSSALCARYSL